MSSRSSISTKTSRTFEDSLGEAQLDVGHFLKNERRRTELMLARDRVETVLDSEETVLVFIESSNASV